MARTLYPMGEYGVEGLSVSAPIPADGCGLVRSVC
jgi:hypothetical protein